MTKKIKRITKKSHYKDQITEDDYKPTSYPTDFNAESKSTINKEIVANDSRTSAPSLDEDEPSSDLYAHSPSALLDKYILSKSHIPLILIICIVVIGLIFIQDNGAGKLANIKDIQWTLIKSAIFSFVMLCLILAYVIYDKLLRSLISKGLDKLFKKNN